MFSRKTIRKTTKKVAKTEVAKPATAEPELKNPEGEADALDQRAAEAAAAPPVVPAVKRLNMISFPVFANTAVASKAGGEQVEIYTGTVPQGIGLDDMRAVIYPKEYWGPDVPASHPDLGLNFQKRRKGDINVTPDSREKLHRCAGLFARDTRDGRRPVGNLSNPKSYNTGGELVEVEKILPDYLVGARVTLRETDQANKLMVEIMPVPVDQTRRNRLFGSPKPATAEEAAATVAARPMLNDNDIPF